MGEFDFAFTLVGLILGLAVTEALSGMVRTLRKHEFRSIGWLTPLLGLVVICDLTTYWGMLWGFRGDMPQLYQAMAVGVIATGIYYVAAGLVFPSEDADLDAHYFAYKRRIIALVVAVNLPIMAYQIRYWSFVIYLVSGTWLFLMGVAFLARSKAVNYAALLSLIALYAYMFIDR
jgi:hypothetical protein